MKITWDRPADRYFEGGTDRGVIYPKNAPAEPWNGLISVADQNSSAEGIEPIYYEGEKFDILTRKREYSGKITAYTYPDIVDDLASDRSVDEGYIITEGAHVLFSMSYRTLINNGSDYKIHLLYNILAFMGSTGHSTLEGSPSAAQFTWDLTSIPTYLPGRHTPFTHIILDTRKINPVDMRYVETALYGTVSQEPRMLSFHELEALDLRSDWNRNG